MKKILILLCIISITPLYSSSYHEHNSSFNKIWTGNFGDYLDLSYTDKAELSNETKSILIQLFNHAIDELESENTPFEEQIHQMELEIHHLNEMLDETSESIYQLTHNRSRIINSKDQYEDRWTYLRDLENVNEELYEKRNALTQYMIQKERLQSNQEKIEKYVSLNNTLIRRNILRISMLGGNRRKEKETIVMITTAPAKATEPQPEPLIHPETLEHYSLAAMDGFKLESCPKHGIMLDYSYRMVEEAYRGISYSFPLYAGWCDESHTAYMFREEDDESKKVVIAEKNRKKARIDEMLKKS